MKFEIDGVAVEETDFATMSDLVSKLATCKSRGDVNASLALMHPDMVLDSPGFGTRAIGLDDNKKVLHRLFTGFPDYSVSMEGCAASPTVYSCWGRVKMTMEGERFGVKPNGKGAELPAAFQFGFRGGLIVYERMLIDMASLCAQNGVSTDHVRSVLFPE